MQRMNIALSCLLVLCSVAFVPAGGAETVSAGEAATSTSEAGAGFVSWTAARTPEIEADRIKERVYFLASPALRGRYPGSQGYRVAADYAASNFEASGLEPIAGTGETPSFFQAVPLSQRKVEAAPEVILRTPSGEQTLADGALKLWTSESLSGDGRQLPVLFAGFGIREPDFGWDDFAGQDISGKIVVVVMGAPTRGEEPFFPPDVHRVYAPLNSIIRKADSWRGAAAVLGIVDGELAEYFPQFPAFPEEIRFVLNEPTADGAMSPPLALMSTELSEAIFSGREVPSAESVSDGRDPSGIVEGVTLGIRVPMVDEAVETWNVMGLVRGTDPELADEFVVVSAHLDHVAPTAEGQIHPGANDNASGAAALLEISRVIAAQPLRRSVLFVLFGAEEGGSMGARHFLAHPPVPLQQIVADVNMDMVARTEEGREADHIHYVIDSGRITPELTDLIVAVNARSLALPLEYVHPTNMGSSDHMSFEAVGIPAVNFYSGKVSETHSPADTPDCLDYEKAEKMAQLVCEITFELGTRQTLWHRSRNTQLAGGS